MNISEVLYMQLRIVFMFCDRTGTPIDAANKLFEENGIYDLISYGYAGYHCGGDELVYDDMMAVLKSKGAIK